YCHTYLYIPLMRDTHVLSRAKKHHFLILLLINYHQNYGTITFVVLFFINQNQHDLMWHNSLLGFFMEKRNVVFLYDNM
ncbi:hypothetical protein ACJX0J_017746, partial [Zea mays]